MRGTAEPRATKIYTVGAVGAVGAAHDSDRTWCLSGITVGLSELLSDYCRTTVRLSGSLRLLSEVTVGLSDRGSACKSECCILYTLHTCIRCLLAIYDTTQPGQCIGYTADIVDPLRILH